MVPIIKSDTQQYLSLFEKEDFIRNKPKVETQRRYFFTTCPRKERMIQINEQWDRNEMRRQEHIRKARFEIEEMSTGPSRTGDSTYPQSPNITQRTEVLENNNIVFYGGLEVIFD